MLAWIVIVGQAGCREEFGHGERLQADRQLRQGDIAQIFCDVARHRFTQRFVIEHTSGDQCAFDTAVVGDAQQRADLRHPAEIVGAHRHDHDVRNRYFVAHAVDFVRWEPSRRVAHSADEILRRNVVEFPAMAVGVEIALVGHFIIHHWHGSIITHGM